MPPKQKQDSETLADRESSAEAKRIRKRATPSLLQAQPPLDTSAIPTALRKCDGVDIVKRNASKKKKYLFIFPGALSLPVAGGKIGSLTSLDTRNPVLNIQFPSGTLRLLGTLVFPQNAFISVKPTKRAVQVIDVFETMIVFSEWRWIGDLASNPGGIPVPLPDRLKAPQEDIWRSASVDAKPSTEGYDTIQLSSDGENAALGDSDEDAWASTTIDRTAPLRSNPRRKGRVVNYSQLENDEESNDDIGECSDGENTSTERGVKRRTSAPQDMDDSVQIIEDENEVKPARASRRKRRKVDYSGDSEEDVEGDGSLDRSDDGGPEFGRHGKYTASQNDLRSLQFDDSVELVEPVKAEEEKTTRRGSRRRRRTIKYSQESGDDYMEADDDDGDKDFAVDADDEEPFKLD